ncbi:hypothetical protein BSBH6_00561 [Bacillus subtilis]|nr:hypothetical protein BSBH6_00561 [Bacillus subtilis]RPK26924.1 hypothetical protein BH5_00559 [Bacillus subtilis]
MRFIFTRFIEFQVFFLPLISLSSVIFHPDASLGELENLFP